jgi:hypothetical protein
MSKCESLAKMTCFIFYEIMKVIITKMTKKFMVTKSLFVLNSRPHIFFMKINKRFKKLYKISKRI